jgi:hypothetical protein
MGQESLSSLYDITPMTPRCTLTVQAFTRATSRDRPFNAMWCSGVRACKLAISGSNQGGGRCPFGAAWGTCSENGFVSPASMGGRSQLPPQTALIVETRLCTKDRK